MSSEAYIPSSEPFHQEGTLRFWELPTGSFLVQNSTNALTFRGTLVACAEWALNQKKENN